MFRNIGGIFFEIALIALNPFLAQFDRFPILPKALEFGPRRSEHFPAFEGPEENVPLLVAGESRLSLSLSQIRVSDNKRRKRLAVEEVSFRVQIPPPIDTNIYSRKFQQFRQHLRIVEIQIGGSQNAPRRPSLFEKLQGLYENLNAAGGYESNREIKRRAICKLVLDYREHIGRTLFVVHDDLGSVPIIRRLLGPNKASPKRIFEVNDTVFESRVIG